MYKVAGLALLSAPWQGESKPYLKGAAADVPASWHFTVDDHEIYQHLPLDESAFHAGDGGKGPGNCRSIGIEICVNRDGDFMQAIRNAAWLCAKLMKEHGIAHGDIMQHNHWSGKDCPQNIRGGNPITWDQFLALVDAEASGQTLELKPSPEVSTAPKVDLSGKSLLRRGSVGLSVVEMQRLLMAKGYSLHPYGADGIFGPLTERRVREFQSENGLVVDGIVGPKTWNALG